MSTYQRTYDFTLETIDVDTDSALSAAHGESVPVVAVNDKARFWGVVNRALLERLLKAESHRREQTEP